MSHRTCLFSDKCLFEKEKYNQLMDGIRNVLEAQEKEMRQLTELRVKFSNILGRLGEIEHTLNLPPWNKFGKLEETPNEDKKEN